MRLKMFLYIIIFCCWGRTASIPQHLINEFKSKIFPIFGLKERPKLDHKPHIPEEMKKMYEIQRSFEYDTASLPLPGLHTRSANTVRTFVHVESPIDEKFVHHNKFRLKFNISTIPKHETLKAAEIKLSRDVIDPMDSSPYQRLLVHDIVQPGKKGVRPSIMRVIDSQLIDVRKNSTLSIDVFPAMERWLTNPKSNHGVLIALHGSKTPTKRHLRLRRDASDLTPGAHLYAYTDDGRNRQKTGHDMPKMRKVTPTNRYPTNRYHKKIDRNPCRRHEMTLDFKDVGWSDWIVAPLGYEAYYCAGECDYPLPEHLNTTNHAIVQSLVNSMKPSEVPKPCCIPTHLSSVSMLYVGNDGNVILKNYKDMVAIGCGCR